MSLLVVCQYILLGGDSAQILLVVKGLEKGHGDTVAACLQRSCLWQHLTILQLTENRRLAEGGANSEFAQWLVGLNRQRDIRHTSYM